MIYSKDSIPHVVGAREAKANADIIAATPPEALLSSGPEYLSLNNLKNLIEEREGIREKKCIDKVRRTLWIASEQLSVIGNDRHSALEIYRNLMSEADEYITEYGFEVPT